MRGRFARPTILKRDTIPSMATEQILALLIAERDKLNAAIEALSGPTKRRGRPPMKSLVSAEPMTTLPTKNRKKRIFSDAQRKAAGDRMRQMWAAKKKAAAKVKKAG